ncbi:hypothetical protein TD95_000985 [Thielaviopsis punctulata]|uniref:Mis12 domain-containing protein n=1 Tax=Thielaviopsis punctulata TaxID=72032 RepID=A0A0F4ZDD7_9PEZI|nr:hypothetical protein TD95_000985 [Thielaviopsis punctulata]
MAEASDAAADIEILTEHFGYPPVSLLDDIINAVNIVAESALVSIEQGLLRSPPSALGFRPPRKPKKSRSKALSADDAAAEAAAAAAAVEEAAKFEIDNGTHQLETLLCSSIDRTFDIFELYIMNNILCLRPGDRVWMRLRHYDGLDFSHTSDTAPSVASVSVLRRKLAASQRLTATLEAEKAQNDALLGLLRGLVARSRAAAAQRGEQRADGARAPGALGFLGDAAAALGAADGAAPLQTTTGFALSQMPALRGLSAALRGLAGKLQPVDGDGTPGRRTWRKGRVEYIEAATRKHLESVRGLELDAHGEVRDGEWQKAGRKIGMHEVKGLEEVVALVGGMVDGHRRGGREEERQAVEVEQREAERGERKETEEEEEKEYEERQETEEKPGAEDVMDQS